MHRNDSDLPSAETLKQYRITLYYLDWEGHKIWMGKDEDLVLVMELIQTRTEAFHAKPDGNIMAIVESLAGGNTPAAQRWH